MSELWRPKAKGTYRKLNQEDWAELWRASIRPKDYLPYERQYENLTQAELLSLIDDARKNHWEILDLQNCGITSLPEKLGELPELHILALGNYMGDGKRGKRNFLSHLPASIVHLENLESLDFCFSSLQVLPVSIRHMKKLRTLGLHRCLLTELPETIGQMENLQFLDLSNSSLKDLPDTIGQLKNLERLDLSYSFLKRLPASIGKIENLQVLDLSCSRIKELPASIGQLGNLKTLRLCCCHLTEIPPSVLQLKPPFVTDDWKAEECVNLTDVKLEQGDFSLFSQPREVIEAYYNLGPPGTIQECKVIFLGDGGAGKTSLIERMVNNKFISGTLPTNGVKMTKWKTTLENHPFTIRILDFGGQEIMHSMHRCFLTSHTVYVVVCESRNDTEIDAVAARWLENIRAYALDCPVVLALNKADLNPSVSVNERNLRERNPQLKRVLQTSAAVEAREEYGVNGLIRAIQKEIPGCINNLTASADILRLKLELENMREDYITSEKYRELCEIHHIEKESLQYNLLNYFKDLGVCYSYESEEMDTRLESVRVLNPAWLTNGIYRLILHAPESGFLSHKEIKDVLRTPYERDQRFNTYTAEEAEFILHVMRKFGISRYIENGMELIPMKLPKSPPDTVDKFPKKDALHLRWEGAYLPNNLIHRLILEKFEDLDRDCVWRTGGRFLQLSGNCRALAEMNDKALDLYVSGGRDSRLYLDTFRVIIQKILDRLNLKTKEVICVTVDGREGQIPYEDVNQQYQDGKKEIYIPGIRSYANPAELLNYAYEDWETKVEQSRPRLENERLKAEIHKLRANTWETYFKIIFAISLAFLAVYMILTYSDSREKLLEWLISLLGDM